MDNVTLMHYPLKRVPPALWCYAVEHAAYILNRSPNRKNTLTPYEMINNIKPDMTNLVPFWSLRMKEKDEYGQQKVYHVECLVMIMRQKKGCK